jgi:hypothetical protein
MQAEEVDAEAGPKEGPPQMAQPLRSRRDYGCTSCKKAALYLAPEPGEKPYPFSKRREAILAEGIRKLAQKFRVGPIDEHKARYIDSRGDMMLLQKMSGVLDYVNPEELDERLQQLARKYGAREVSSRWITMFHFDWEKMLGDMGLLDITMGREASEKESGMCGCGCGGQGNNSAGGGPMGQVAPLEDTVDDEWVSCEEVAKVCGSCADKMKKSGIKKVRRAYFMKAIKEASLKTALEAIRKEGAKRTKR